MSVPSYHLDSCPRTAIKLTQEQYNEMNQKRDLYTLKDFKDIEDPVIIGTDTKNVYTLEGILGHLRLDDDWFILNNLSKSRIHPMDRDQQFTLANVQAVHYDLPSGPNNNALYTATEARLKRLTGMDEAQRLLNINEPRPPPRRSDFLMTIENIMPAMTEFINDLYVQRMIGLHEKRERFHVAELVGMFRDFAQSKGEHTLASQTSQLLSRAINNVAFQFPEKIAMDLATQGSYYFICPVPVHELIEKFRKYLHDIHEGEINIYTTVDMVQEFKVMLKAWKIQHADISDATILGYIKNLRDDRRCPNYMEVVNSGPATRFLVGRDIVSFVLFHVVSISIFSSFFYHIMQVMV